RSPSTDTPPRSNVAGLGKGHGLADFVREVGRHPEAGHYLANRRISPALALRFGLGYAPRAWTALRDALAPRRDPSSCRSHQHLQPQKS
ncbi:MAG TPA: hypothetical protein VLX28_26125, partial [Thermoanaerobaculia bacterium]|nr:hypothetical protein [Thermoanaerobaculia bacterium]